MRYVHKTENETGILFTRWCLGFMGILMIGMRVPSHLLHFERIGAYHTQ